jgi:hypothetical protein
MNVNYLLKRYKAAVAVKRKSDGLREQAGKYSWPNAQQMTITAETSEAGKLNTEVLYDSTAMNSAYRMTSGIFSYLMPVGSKWHEFRIAGTTEDIPPNMVTWLSKATEMVHQEIWRSNFQREMFMTIRSMTVFGNGIISVEMVDDSLTYRAYHIGTIFFEVNSKGIIDVVYRQIFYNARQAEQEFGREVLSPKILKALEKGDTDTKFEFVHIAIPNEDYDGGKVGSSKYKSLYLDVQSKREVKTGKFDSLPYLAARFSLTPGDPYGRCPAIELLPEISMLDRMKKSYILAQEKAVDPALVAEDDGVVGQPATGPGDMMYMRAGAKFPQPLNQGINIPLGREGIMDQQQIVKTGFFNDLFDALADGSYMTAREVDARIEDKIIHIAPAVTSLEKEMTSLEKEIFSPLLERTLELLIKAKKIPKPPIDADLEIVFTGRLAMAMAASASGAMDVVLARWAPYSQNAPVFDNVDWDKSFRLSWRDSGSPAEGLVDPEVRDQKRAADAEANQMAQMTQLASEGSEAIKNLSGPVDETSAMATIGGLG